MSNQHTTENGTPPEGHQETEMIRYGWSKRVVEGHRCKYPNWLSIFFHGGVSSGRIWKCLCGKSWTTQLCPGYLDYQWVEVK